MLSIYSMKKNILLTFIESLNLCLFTFLLFAQETSSEDQNFLDCQSRNCGNQTIKYPFYIEGVQNSSCGYPGFGISCQVDTPILQAPNNKFQIQQIFYNNQTLHLLDTAVVDLQNSCFTNINNISLNPERFQLSSTLSDLYLFSNCSTYPKNLSDYKIGCEGKSGNGNETGYVLFEGNKNLSYAMGICGKVVLAKVEVGFKSDGIVNYSVALKGGITARWIASDCSDCEGSGGRCGFDERSYHFQCFCSDRPHKVRCNKAVLTGKKNLTIILATVIPGCILMLVMATLTLCYWKKWKDASTHLTSRNIPSNPSSKSDLEGGGFFLGISVFSYAELEEATDDFDLARELGNGGFGSVYHGKLQDGREVAVKRLYEHNYKRATQFRNEIDILTRLHHRNLVTLYGCTSGQSRELLLVYEYIPNGTVADHLHGDRANIEPLTWPIRINIAIETASALAYLHKSDIIHRDVKTNNILLDSNFVVKVADFGLSRLFPMDVTHVSTAPQGTPGYVDPEYHQCYQLTEKSDVYSFGVVLIELVSSMPAVDINRHRYEINLANLAMNKIQNKALDELIDPSLGYESDPSIERMITSVVEVAFRCLQLEKEMRPSMEEVFETLVEIRDYKDDTNMETKPTPHSPEGDHVVLLKTNSAPPSPDSVAHKWLSASDSSSSGKQVLLNTI